ncbi:MAG: recombination mediator RecR [Brevinematales bacterium]|jgi:recombination protein RecR
MFSEALQDFVSVFSELPGVGRRSSERIAYHLLIRGGDLSERLSGAIDNLKKNTLKCSICGNLSDYDPCLICTDPQRERNILCIVESPADIYHIESTSCYRGVYHSLGGVLSPLNGITPEDLNLKSLAERLKTSSFDEIIFATSATTEGDATIMYIKDMLKDSNVVFSHLARGIPVGMSIQYAGNKSLSEAMRGRERLID